MPTILEDDFDDMMDTPMEREMKKAERAVYTNPNGWQYVASQAISDINSRLQIQWGHGPLTRAEMNEIGNVVRQRIANRVNPVWNEILSNVVINNVVKRDGVRPTEVTAEVVTGGDVLKQSKDAVDAAIEDANAGYEEDLDAADFDSAEG